MPTLDTTVGGVNANSYPTLAEANTYHDERYPALVPPWIASGDDAIRSLITGTRLIDTSFTPRRDFIKETTGLNARPAHMLVRRQWTGTPASTTQRRAWPRIGMYDRNGNALDVAISSISVANPTVITTATPHRRVTNDKVFISDSDSTPSIDGERTVTVISETSFSVPVNVTAAGTTGKVSWIPQELKDAVAELAGQLRAGDRALDNTTVVQGIKSVKAGSVEVAFKDDIAITHVLPDAVMNLLPPSWFTDEQVEYLASETAQFSVLEGS